MQDFFLPADIVGKIFNNYDINLTLLGSSDSGAQSVKPLVYLGISPVYLLYMVDATDSIGAHGSYQHRDSCPDVRRGHILGSQAETPIQAYYNSSMRIA